MVIKNELVVDANTINLDPIQPEVFLDFERDDATGKILDARQNADLTPAQKAMLSIKNKREAESFGSKALGVASAAVDVAADVASDVVGGIVEAPRQALGGFLDATAEAAEVLESVFGQLPTAGEDYEPLKIEAQPRTVTGQGVRSVSQFLTGFIPA